MSAPDAPLVAGVADDALRWAAAMREAASIQAAEVEAKRDYCARFREAWNADHRLPDGWQSDIGRWYEMGIELELLYDAIDATWDARRARSPLEVLLWMRLAAHKGASGHRREIVADDEQAEVSA